MQALSQSLLAVAAVSSGRSCGACAWEAGSKAFQAQGAHGAQEPLRLSVPVLGVAGIKAKGDAFGGGVLAGVLDELASVGPSSKHMSGPC